MWRISSGEAGPVDWSLILPLLQMQLMLVGTSVVRVVGRVGHAREATTLLHHRSLASSIGLLRASNKRKFAITGVGLEKVKASEVLEEIKLQQTLINLKVKKLKGVEREERRKELETKPTAKEADALGKVGNEGVKESEIPEEKKLEQTLMNLKVKKFKDVERKVDKKEIERKLTVMEAKALEKIGHEKVKKSEIPEEKKLQQTLMNLKAKTFKDVERKGCESKPAVKEADSLEKPAVDLLTGLEVQTVRHLELEDDDVGRLLGPRGELKEKQKKSGARIHFKKREFIGDMREATIVGTKAQVEAAVKMIQEDLDQERARFGNEPRQFSMDEKIAAKIIGFKGRNMRETEANSGAKLTVSDGGAERRILTIQGTHYAMDKAEQMVVEQIKKVINKEELLLTEYTAVEGRPAWGQSLAQSWPLLQGWYQGRKPP